MALLTPVLKLGDFDFLDFEQPTAVTFGKEQSSYKHLIIGGGRVIDLLGAGDPDITWSGYFTGAQAELRARFLEGLVKAGQPLKLRTSDFVKDVVIINFSYGFHFVFPVAYTISLQVLQDDTLPVNIIVPGDLTDAIINTLLQAQDIAQLVANPSVTTALALALRAAQEVSPFDAAANTAIMAALSSAQAAQSVVGGAISSTEKSIFG